MSIYFKFHKVVWFAFLAECKTFNVVGVGRHGNIYIQQFRYCKQIYGTSKLSRRYQRIFIHQLNDFYITTIRIYSATSTESFAQIESFVWEI